MQNPVRGLLGHNPFEKAFDDFNEDAFFEDLHNQVKTRSYFQRYKGFKTTLVALSYLFNTASILTASYAVFYIVNWITGIAEIGYIVAGVFLFFLEKIKRKSGREFFKIYYFNGQFSNFWFALSFVCFLASVGSSGYGVKQGTESQAPSHELVQADSTAQWYKGEIAKLDQQVIDLQAQKDTKSGITLYNLAPAITEATTTVNQYRQRLQELEKQTAGENVKLQGEYMAELELTAWVLVGITIFCELCFIFCIGYEWYFYFRSYIERIKTKGIPQQDPQEPTAEVRQLYQQTPYPTPPPKTATQSDQRPQIGFRLGYMEETPVQACTDVYTQEIDRYTVPHTYQKGGQTKTVRYTLPQVRARVGQYARGIQEAEKQELGAEVVANRKEWLNYWQEKEQELLSKTKNKV